MKLVLTFVVTVTLTKATHDIPQAGRTAMDIAEMNEFVCHALFSNEPVRVMATLEDEDDGYEEKIVQWSGVADGFAYKN